MNIIVIIRIHQSNQLKGRIAQAGKNQAKQARSFNFLWYKGSKRYRDRLDNPFEKKLIL